MILVDIYIPAVDHTYDFKLDEFSLIDIVIEEITEMIEQKEQCKFCGNIDDLLLCSADKQKILPRSVCLNECDIVTGSRLILI